MQFARQWDALVYKPARLIVHRCKEQGHGERRTDAQDASAVLGIRAVALPQEQLDAPTLIPRSHI